MRATAISEPTNGARVAIEHSKPYIATVAIEGTADLLFHRWNCEAVAEKAASAKGSKAKKSDDIQSYLYRTEKGNIALPGEYLRMAVLGAAKFRQDPRSPRKSALDLYKAGVISLTPLADLGAKDFDYCHQCRVTVQRNGITRSRPAMKAGWKAQIDLLVNLPEYISPNDLHEALNQAGKLIGVGDFRPTYGRFLVKSFDVGIEK